MDTEKRILLEAYLDGELSSRQARELIHLCRQDPDFRAALVDESVFLQQIHIALHERNLQEDSRDFASECVDAVLSVDATDAAVRQRGRLWNHWKPLALAAGLLLVLGVYGLLHFSGQKATRGPIVRVVTASPGVTIQSHGQSAPVTAGDVLYPDDKLVTGKSQKAVLIHSTSASRFKLGENSHFTFKNEMLASLDQGRVDADFPPGKLKETFVFETPHAVATVIGTRLSLNVNKQSSRLDVYRGLVGYQPVHDKDGQMLYVSENEYAVAEPGIKMTVLPSGTAYESFSSLSRIYCDKKVIFREDFANSVTNWQPVAATYPDAVGSDPRFRVLGKSSGHLTNSVSVTNTLVNGKISRALRIEDNAADDLIYGVLNRYSESPESYSIEMKLFQSAIAAKNDTPVRSIFSAYKSPSNENTVNMLPHAQFSGIPHNKWVDARFEYVIEPDGTDNLELDTKIFIDGKLNSWLKTKGGRDEFGGEMLILAANGDIMLDNVVIRRMVPRRVNTGLLALYRFDEGEGKVIRDVSGVDEPLDMIIGKPESARWKQGALAVEKNAAIRTQAARKIASAWRRDGELTIELWVRPFIDRPGQNTMSSILALKSNRYHIHYSQIISPNEDSTPSHPRHFVLTLSKDRGQVKARFFKDSKPPSERSENTEKHDKELEGAHSVKEASLSIKAADATLAQDSLRLLLQGGKEVGKTWKGEYHMLAVYNHALTPREIWRNYHAGAFAHPETQNKNMQVFETLVKKHENVLDK